MPDNKKKNNEWGQLSMKDKAALIDIYVKHGFTDIDSIRDDYERNREHFMSSDANFVNRLRTGDTTSVDLGNGKRGTHLMSYANDGEKATIYPLLQESNGTIENHSEDERAFDSAVEKGDTVNVSTPFAEFYTPRYKLDYSNFFKIFNNVYGNGDTVDVGNKFDDGGDIDNNTDEVDGGILKSSVVSEKLSRDNWDKLYQNGKVELKDIPREYQSWIEGNNSNFKKSISEYGKNFITKAKDDIKLNKDRIIRNIAAGITEDKDIIWSGGKNFLKIPRGAIRGLINGSGKRYYGKYRNANAFLYGPENFGYIETDDNSGPQFNSALSKYNFPIKEYHGTINPYGEYLIPARMYDEINNLAASGKITYMNQNEEYLFPIEEPYEYNILDDVDMRLRDKKKFITYFPSEVNEVTPYADDVSHYPVIFKNDSDGNIYVDAADLYDFNGLRFNNTMLNVGKPYILRQNNIPVRFITDEEYDYLPYRDRLRVDNFNNAIHGR